MQVNDTLPDQKTAQELGLTKEEFARIKELMGRAPNSTELQIFAAMWSEQCSYKNSLRWIKTLPREGKPLLVNGGVENAGLVDIGDGLACAFKIEAFNREVSIDPYNGSGAGLGGIHRDIFTMGARPVAAFNSLRFGSIETRRSKELVRSVAQGMGDYGNALGIPTVGGEVRFDPGYENTIAANAMSVGTVQAAEAIFARADGPGNPVFILGAPTARNLVTSAPQQPDDKRSETAPPVHIGDPFLEKRLLEAVLEALQTHAIIGMQDLGAAGIACAAAEMCAKSSTGMKIELEKIPQNAPGMSAAEILLSESPERMLFVSKKGMEQILAPVFEKWDLLCVQIGQVTDNGRVIATLSGEPAADITAQALVIGGGAPVYERSQQRPKYLNNIGHYKLSKVKSPNDYVQTAWKLFSSPNIVSKKWIYEQSDSMAGINNLTLNRPADAALVRIKDTRRALALTIGCNAAYVYADPYFGAMIAVSQAARNIVCSGAEPLALTNCLNFGNPYDPEVYWQFSQAVRGVGDAARKLGIPVSGGKVSFYNQTVDGEQDKAIPPTPTIGMLGLLNDYEELMSLFFKEEGRQIYMIGTPHNDLGSSEYLRVVHGIWHSPPPVFDLDEEFHIQKNLRKIIQMGLIESAHDISEGGLLVCLMECAMVKGLGFDIETDTNFRKDAYLFGESQSRIVVATKEENEDELVNYLNSNNLPFSKLGEVIGKQAVIDGKNFGAISKWKGLYDNFMGDKLE